MGCSLLFSPPQPVVTSLRNLHFYCKEANSCLYLQVVQLIKTHSRLLSVLSIESSIDRSADVEGIELQKAGGCPRPTGFISLADCQKPSDSAGNQ